jgi:methionyl-tRNA formyltransferase
MSGAKLLVATMDGIESGELEPRPQPADGVTLAPKITSEDARVRWDQPAPAVSRQVRACTPAPGAWTQLTEARIKLWPFAAAPADDHDGTPGPGELRVRGSRVLVGTATAPVQLGDVQPPGKRRMPAADWARGLRLDAADAVLS